MNTRLGMLPPKGEKPYTREEQIMLRDFAGKIPFDELLDKVNEFGFNRTDQSVKSQCFKLGWKLGKHS